MVRTGVDLGVNDTHIRGVFQTPTSKPGARDGHRGRGSVSDPFRSQGLEVSPGGKRTHGGKSPETASQEEGQSRVGEFRTPMKPCLSSHASRTASC
jgi:hypothetical protein